MNELVFQADDVRRIVEHALASNKHEPRTVRYDKKMVAIKKPGVPAVTLVHDEGVYLMSNGRPRDIIGPDLDDRIDESKNEGRSFVAYASGCNPEKNRDWQHWARIYVGGDDFSETLLWIDDLKKLLDGGATQIVITFESDPPTRTLSARYPKKLLVVTPDKPSTPGGP